MDSDCLGTGGRLLPPLATVAGPRSSAEALPSWNLSFSFSSWPFWGLKVRDLLGQPRSLGAHLCRSFLSLCPCCPGLPTLLSKSLCIQSPTLPLQEALPDASSPR